MNQPKILTSGIREVQFGKGVTLVEPVNLYECTIGDGCFIGPFVEIQRGVKVGKSCRIQSHSFLSEGVTLDEHCFIGHGVLFINDTFKKGHPTPDPSDWKPTKIGHHVSIGSNATILPVNIAPHTVIGAGAVVTRDITTAGIYAGNPARMIKPLPKGS